MSSIWWSWGGVVGEGGDASLEAADEAPRTSCRTGRHSIGSWRTHSPAGVESPSCVGSLEWARDLIRERTTAGLAAARARGRRGGRPSVMTAHKAQVAQEMYRSGQYTVATIAKTLGVSRASIYRRLVGPGH
jgi:hypothetical protein